MISENETQDQKDAYFMELALHQAELAVSKGQTPFGSVVVNEDRKLIGEGHNSVRSDFDPAAHAEVVAIRNAWRSVGNWQLMTGSTLYTSCEPCLLCSFVITQVGFKRVVFAARGTDVPGYKPLLGADLFKAADWVNQQPDWTPLEVVPDFMRNRALKIIAAFPWSQAHNRSVIKESKQ
ncbi:MAG TPA: nucleoside deaminase [Acidobacteriota bacterium]|nr:nucleoside deaminase [Acidobacteriota bacterium]